MKGITLILVLIMIAGVVGISGCTDSGAAGSQKTFSDGSIKFNYSEDFENATSPGNIISGDKSWITVGFLGNNATGTAIDIAKNKETKDPNGARQVTDAATTTSNGGVSTGEILSHTTETNPNGITIFKSIHTLKDPDTGETVKYIDFYFKDKKGVVYSISVYNAESEYQDVSDTADMIFKSLSLN